MSGQGRLGGLRDEVFGSEHMEHRKYPNVTSILAAAKPEITPQVLFGMLKRNISSRMMGKDALPVPSEIARDEEARIELVTIVHAVAAAEEQAHTLNRGSRYKRIPIILRPTDTRAEPPGEGENLEVIRVYWDEFGEIDGEEKITLTVPRGLAFPSIDFTQTSGPDDSVDKLKRALRRMQKRNFEDQGNGNTALPRRKAHKPPLPGGLPSGDPGGKPDFEGTKGEIIRRLREL